MPRARFDFAYSVIAPHFDAVRHAFSRFEPEPGVRLAKLGRTKLVVTRAAFEPPRHYARCRTDGYLVEVAPEAMDLSHETLVAMLTHELGHAADFAYPSSWVVLGTAEDRYGFWIGGRDDKAARRWRGLWHERSDAQIEQSADAIAYTVTGLRVEYCGPCMLQCFSGGVPRPASLR